MVHLVSCAGAMAFSAPCVVGIPRISLVMCSPTTATEPLTGVVIPTDRASTTSWYDGAEPSAFKAPSVTSWYDIGVRLTAAPEPAPVPVVSWYDNGVRLSPQVNSWYDGGVRLDLGAAAAAAAAAAADMTAAREVDFNALVILERIGQGTQSEVLLGELPNGVGHVAVKVGLKMKAIAREATVLSALSGTPGFPELLHYDAAGPGSLVVNLLGHSLADLLPRPSEHKHELLSGPTLLRIGRGVLRRVRQLHLAGFGDCE